MPGRQCWVMKAYTLTPKRTGKPGSLARGGRGFADMPMASLAMDMPIISPKAGKRCVCACVLEGESGRVKGREGGWNRERERERERVQMPT